MVTVFFWNRGQDGRKWNVKQYYHVKSKYGQHCWEEQGLDFLKRNPYVPYIRKHSLDLSPEDKRRRLLILKRKAALDQDLGQLNVGKPDYAERVATIEAKKAGLILEIAKVGGAPPKWIKELLGEEV